VRTLVAEGRDFTSLSLAEWQAFSDRIGADVSEAISPQASVAAKRTPQSTNPAAVQAALEELSRWLGPEGASPTTAP
jgi:argininosuccinate lyase